MIFFFSWLYKCSNENYKDVSSSESDKQYYNLVEKQVYDDNGSIINFSIPNKWTQVDNSLLAENTLAQYELIENTGYSFSVEKLESRNTVKLNDKRYLDKNKIININTNRSKKYTTKRKSA